MPHSDMGPLRASVIVPVYNGAQTLRACLEALSRQTVGPDAYEVIVVDDGSTDGSAEIAVDHGVMVISQDHAGPASARNRGAQRARGRLLLFTDADCEPLPGWIEQMMTPFTDPDVVGVKGVYCTQQGSLVARFTQAEYEEKYDRLMREAQIDFIDTYAAAYRRDVFLALGGFNPGLLRDQDQELSFRVAKAGHKLVFAPKAVVYHQHPGTVWRYAWRKAQIGRWKVRVHALHPTKAFRDSYTPWTQKTQLMLLPLVAVASIMARLGLLSWIAAAILSATGLMTTIPLMVKARGQGWQVVTVTPVLTLVRAIALELGILWGMGDQIWLALSR
jgi:glycosyltransferase involved in cell wall biosynthesis